MSSNLETVKNLLKDATSRLRREEMAENPDLGRILFSLSSVINACVGVVSSVENIYIEHYGLEKDHNKRLRDLSKKVIYLSAAISVGGGAILIVGKWLVGVLTK